MRQTVLLTGVTGYIAKHTALHLLKAGFRVCGSMRDMSRADEVRSALRPHLPEMPDLDARLTLVALDLTSDTGWQAAADGCDVLIHMASPFPMVQPKDPADLTQPAVDGTLRALRTADAAGIKRVILTSSTAAITGTPLPSNEPYDERHWTDPDDPAVTAYSASKTLAERAAWDFVETHAPQIGLTVVNPGFVVGAPLDPRFGTSIAVIERILRAKDPMVPRLGFASVDVRDVAEMHVVAIDQPSTAGQRILTVDRFLWFADMAQAIKSALPGRKIVTREAPDAIVKLLGLFDPAIRSITPSLGRMDQTDNSRACAVLGRIMRPAKHAVVETARYLVDHDLV